MQKRHRIFISINLPDDIKKALVAYQKKWKDVPVKWTDPENLHITLVFLGDLADVELGQACVAVKQIVKNHQSFDVTLSDIGYGPEGKIPPRYIWAGGQASNELSLLKKDLENGLATAARIKPDKNMLSLHITLARVKEWEWRAIEPEERPEIKENLNMIFTVESVEVMESELKRGGPRYAVIESHELQ